MSCFWVSPFHISELSVCLCVCACVFGKHKIYLPSRMEDKRKHSYFLFLYVSFSLSFVFFVLMSWERSLKEFVGTEERWGKICTNGSERKSIIFSYSLNISLNQDQIFVHWICTWFLFSYKQHQGSPACGKSWNNFFSFK